MNRPDLAPEGMDLAHPRAARVDERRTDPLATRTTSMPGEPELTDFTRTWAGVLATNGHPPVDLTGQAGGRPGPTEQAGGRPGPTEQAGGRPGPTEQAGGRPGPTEHTGALYGLAVRLAAALRAEPFSPAPGDRIGADLVAAEFTAPKTIGATIEVIGQRLLTDLGLTHDQAGVRLSGLLATLATGYARALRDHALASVGKNTPGTQAAPAAQAAQAVPVTQAVPAAQADPDHELREMQARFRHAALHDSLTGLPNRMQFEQWLACPVVSASDGFGVCSIDLDGFQKVNDSLGPRVGDRLLISVGQRLAHLVGEDGHRLARLGGDEFGLLIDGRSGLDRPGGGEEITKVADQVVGAFVEPFRIDAHHLTVSASVGLAEMPRGADPIEMMRAADIARRWAKVDGGAAWRLYERHRSALDVARYRLSAAMPAALDRGEFGLVYQPLVRLADGGLVGVEALARWYHPELGLLGAEEFIGLAEHTGLIVPLGLRLLDTACKQAAAWQEENPGLVVSVNLAARQIRQPGLVASVAELLDRAGLAPGQLQLEITESAVVGTDRTTLDVLYGLADLGVLLVLDDFGTGYANLAHLDTLPLHGLKLAAQFMHRRGRRTPGRHRSFLTAVVSVGQTLGLSVTAEGIETARQADRLRRIGCQLGQGWYFGRPVPPAQITDAIGRGTGLPGGGPFGVTVVRT